MASGDTKTEAMLNVLGNGGTGDEFRGCCNTKTQGYILDAIDRINSLTPGGGEDFTGATSTTAGVHGLVPAPAAGDQDKYLKADGTWSTVSGGGGGPTVVQTTGTSTTDVMSQNATTSMVFDDAGTNEKIRISNENSSSMGTYSVKIGRNVTSVNTGNYSISIGDRANASRQNSVAIGQLSGGSSNFITALGNEASINGVTNHYSTAIGAHARVDSYNAPYAVAIGAYSNATSQGEVSFGGSTLNTRGYNNTDYRLLTNVHDPVNAHDAATKGYVDSHAGGGGVLNLYVDINKIPTSSGLTYNDVIFYKDINLTTPYTINEIINAAVSSPVYLISNKNAYGYSIRYTFNSVSICDDSESYDFQGTILSTSDSLNIQVAYTGADNKFDISS